MNTDVSKLFTPTYLTFLNGSVMDFETNLGIRQYNVACDRRDGKKTVFVSKETVSQSFQNYSELWVKYFSKTTTSQSVARACAHFWYTFILIHPFENGNGRTGKRVLEEALQKLGFDFAGFYLIDRYLFTGTTTKDLYELENLFLASIRNNKKEEKYYETQNL